MQTPVVQQVGQQELGGPAVARVRVVLTGPMVAGAEVPAEGVVEVLETTGAAPQQQELAAADPEHQWHHLSQGRRRAMEVTSDPASLGGVYWVLPLNP